MGRVKNLRALVCRWVCLLVILGTLGCRPDLGEVPGRVSLGTTAQVRTLDPADAYEIFAGAVLYNLGDRLYTYAPGTSELVPQLATALPEVSADGLTYRIPLRQGVLFHDGTPFNASAMAFSLQRFIANGGQPSFLLSEPIAKVQATGPYELTIVLKKPFGAFPALLAFSGACAVSPRAYSLGPNQFRPDTFVGTGPYRLAEFDNDSLKLDPFPQYWGQKARNQGIDIQSFSSGANLYSAFRTASIDLAYQTLDPDQIRSLETGARRGRWQMVQHPGEDIYYWTLNLHSPPLDDRRVRQALARLMNRPLIDRRVFYGQVKPLYSLIPTVLRASEPVFAPYGNEQTTQARAILTQAGYSPDHPLDLELWYRSNLVSNELAVMVIKAWIESQLPGIVAVSLHSVESTTAYQNLDQGVYPTFLLDWTADFLDPDSYLQPFLACDQGSEAAGCTAGASKEQGSFYFNPQVNQLIDQERRSHDPQKRQEVFTQIQTILARDIPFIPLWQSKNYLFAQANLRGVSLEVTQKVPFWTLEKPQN